MKEIDFRTDLLPLKDVLYRLAYRITNRTDEAEDIVEDTLIKVWENRQELTDVKNLAAYCTTICRNLALDTIEKLNHQNLSLDDMNVEYSTNHTPLHDLEHKELLHSVRQSMLQLPEIQRSCLHLRDVEGYSYEEIGEMLKLTEGQVKINIFRGRQKLRELLKVKD